MGQSIVPIFPYQWFKAWWESHRLYMVYFYGLCRPPPNEPPLGLHEDTTL